MSIVRYEFVLMCIDVLWHTPRAMLDLAVRNMSDSETMFARRNRMYWRRKARAVDRVSRVLIPG